MRKPLSFGATMLASALGVVIISVVAGLLMFVMMIGMVATLGSMNSEPTAVVRSSTFLTIDLGRISGDRTPSALMQWLSDGKTVGLIDATKAIRSAATDDHIVGLLLKDNGAPLVAWASMEELRDAVEEFRQSGKPVVSYATAYSQQGYYLATTSDVIALHPSGMVDFRGLSSEVMYYKDMLDKLGVEMQLIRPESCAYKSAGEVYTMNHMSEANREQIRAYRSSIWKQAIADIAEARNLSTSRLQGIADSLTGYLATDALQARLIDTLCFEEDMRTMLRNRYSSRHLIPIEKYATNANANATTKKDYIAVVYAEGNVVDGSSRGFDEGVFGDDIVKALRKASTDEKVKAIVLRINSPGGQATASESMTHAVMSARERKPVVVSMGDVAASAGYELACMADCIVAHPMTITGSIGVFGTVPNLQRLMQHKLGLNVDTMATNRNAAALSVFRPLSPVARQLMIRNVEDFYKVFVGRVAEGRKMSYDEVHSIARGRVWSGADAKRIGLVDTLGGFDLALNIAAELGGVDSYCVKTYPSEKDTWTLLAELFGEGDPTDLDLATKIRLAWLWRTNSRHLPVLSQIETDLHYMATCEGLQARLPYIEVED